MDWTKEQKELRDSITLFAYLPSIPDMGLYQINSEDPDSILDLIQELKYTLDSTMERYRRDAKRRKYYKASTYKRILHLRYYVQKYTTQHQTGNILEDMSEQDVLREVYGMPMGKKLKKRIYPGGEK